MSKENTKPEELETEETTEETTENVEVAEETSETAGSELEEKISKLEEELKNEKDKYMRLFAEFDNFRKRTSKEKTEAYGDATAKTIGELLPAIDNFDRALDTPCTDENFKKGVEMIFNQMSEILTKMGVSEIEAQGKPFDPNLHNAVMHIEDENLGENVVATVFQKGFLLGERVIRFATVQVAN